MSLFKDIASVFASPFLLLSGKQKLTLSESAVLSAALSMDLSKPRPWEEETGIWSYPEVWKEVSPDYYEKRYLAEGLGEEYDPTLPTEVPEYPSMSSLTDELLNFRKREAGRKGRASTRVTKGNLGELSLSGAGLFSI